MREVYSSAIGIIKFWINTVLFFEVVNLDVIIKNIIPVIISAGYGIIYYHIFMIDLKRLVNFYLCFLIGFGVFLYAFPFKLIIGIYLGIELMVIVLFVSILDNKLKVINKKRNEIKLIERNERESFVYMIILYNDEEHFIKIGLSDNPNNRFFNFKADGFNIEIINIFYFKNRPDAIIKEREFHSIYKKYLYNPKTKFEGYTECFSMDLLNDIDLQNNANDLQKSVIMDLKEGISSKEICDKFNLKPYQVTRIKQKLLKKQSNARKNK